MKSSFNNTLLGIIAACAIAITFLIAADHGKSPSVGGVFPIDYLSLSMASTTAVSVGSGSTLILASSTNPQQRAYTVLSNDSASTVPVYISLGLPASTGTGIRLAPGATYTINGNNLWSGAIYGQAASATTVNIETFQ